jgi:hypothetical protein
MIFPSFTTNRKQPRSAARVWLPCSIIGWNSVYGLIFYGKSSEISTNRKDDQEVAVLALHVFKYVRRGGL